MNTQQRKTTELCRNVLEESMPAAVGYLIAICIWHGVIKDINDPNYAFVLSKYRDYAL